MTGRVIAFVLCVVAFSYPQSSQCQDHSLPGLRAGISYSMPVGPDPQMNISDYEEDESHAPAGFVAVSPMGDAYVYDLENDNLKVFSPHGIGVISGPKRSGVLGGEASDVAVNDSAIFVLGDRITDDAHRFTLARRFHTHGDWERVPFFYGPEGLPPDSVPATVRSLATNVGRLYLGPDDVIYFYQRLAYESYPVARGDSMLPIRAQAALGFEGREGLDGRRYLALGGMMHVTWEGGSEEWPFVGPFLGADRMGRLYAIHWEGETCLVSVVRSQRLVVRSILPAPFVWKHFSEGPFYISPAGGLYQFHLSEALLSVQFWELPPDSESSNGD